MAVDRRRGAFPHREAGARGRYGTVYPTWAGDSGIVPKYMSSIEILCSEPRSSGILLPSPIFLEIHRWFSVCRNGFPQILGNRVPG